MRSAANLARLPAERSRLQREFDAIRRRLDKYTPLNRGMIPMRRALEEQLSAVGKRLDSLSQIERTMGRGNRQLLSLDTTGERVKAAVAVGNVDTAKHVAVFTPGFETTVDGDLAAYDTNMQKLQDTGRQIQELKGEHGDIAAVTWIGYEAPQASEIPDVTGDSVAFPHAAEEGGQKLAGFVNGIDAARPGDPPHLTALGHSYGSTTTGYALQQDTAVDDAVLFGSPGIGTHDPADLRVDDGRMYAEIARDDSVPYAAVGGTLGQSPYLHPGEFQSMSTDASTGEFGPLEASYGHSEYLKDKTTSQYNMAAVTTGHPEMIKR